MDKYNPNDPYFLAKKPDNPHQINMSDWIFRGEFKVDIKLSDVDNTDQYEHKNTIFDLNKFSHFFRLGLTCVLAVSVVAWIIIRSF